jgi:hypothetical protein
MLVCFLFLFCLLVCLTFLYFIEIRCLQSDARHLATTVHALVSADTSTVLPLLANALTRICQSSSESGTPSDRSPGLLLIDLVQRLRPSILQYGPIDMDLVHRYSVSNSIPSLAELVRQYCPEYVLQIL